MAKMRSKKQQWAWSYLRNSGGPFPSKQEAIEDARDKLDQSVFVNVGRVRYLDPVNFAGALMSRDVLAAMDRLAELVYKTNTIRFTLQLGDDLNHDKRIEKAASNALDLLIKKWARKHVRTDAWVKERGEMVKI